MSQYPAEVLLLLCNQQQHCNKHNGACASAHEWEFLSSLWAQKQWCSIKPHTKCFVAADCYTSCQQMQFHTYRHKWSSPCINVQQRLNLSNNNLHVSKEKQGTQLVGNDCNNKAQMAAWPTRLKRAPSSDKRPTTLSGWTLIIAKITSNPPNRHSCCMSWHSIAELNSIPQKSLDPDQLPIGEKSARQLTKALLG